MADEPTCPECGHPSGAHSIDDPRWDRGNGESYCHWAYNGDQRELCECAWRPHQWERIPEMRLFSRCSVCGWGWDVFADNDFPCPGVRVTQWPSQLS